MKIAVEKIRTESTVLHHAPPHELNKTITDDGRSLIEAARDGEPSLHDYGSDLATSDFHVFLQFKKFLSSVERLETTKS